ncbi:MAG TPA: hypothetical protein VGU66_13435 [Candidatus Elarobacter sp.]|nr:hypothetical protein [Candidatus Elarobacter sp.]
MPLELLERDQVLATIMPGHGGPGGDEAESGDDESGDDESEEETEGDPS